MLNITSKQLRRAANVQDRITKLQKELAALLRDGDDGIFAPTEGKKRGPKRRRKMSRAARAKIAAAQTARWAKAKGSKPVKPALKKKRKMSAAGRARIIAAQKLRWAKIKAAKGM